MKALGMASVAAAWALACLAPVGALRLEDAKKQFPVSKVVQLLTDMKAQLEVDADKDEAVYEKMACWCSANDKQKTQAISDAAAHLTHLEGAIQKDIATVESLKVEIKALAKEIAQNQAALATASAQREKQAADFYAEEKDLLESIRQVKAAIVIIAKHHSGDAGAVFLSETETRTLSKAAAVAVQRGPHLSADQKRALTSFLQEHRQPDYFDAAPTFKQAYAPQSGQIYGILQQMQETFEENLAQSQKDELQARDAFAEIKAAKEAEIAAGQKRLAEKKELLGTTGNNLAQMKGDREDTAASQAADEKFLQDLKSRCAMTDDEWEVRQKTRMAEIEACSKAIEILSTDSARALFSKTLNAPEAPSLLQATRTTRGARRSRAADALMATAVRIHSPKLALLASSVRIDAFTRVKKAIDDLVGELVAEKETDIQHKQSCVDELNENEVSTAEQTHSKGKLEMKVKTLSAKIEELENTMATLTSEIADLKQQREEAKENRDAERADFLRAEGEQHETQALLQQAHDALTEVYKSITANPSNQADGTLLTQKGPYADTGLSGASRMDAPVAKGRETAFERYEKNGASAGVVAMVEQIIKDSKLLEAQLEKSETEARNAYHEFVQQTQVSVDAKNDAIVDRRQEKSATEVERTETQTELEGVVAEVEALARGAEALHKDCDFDMKNFDTKQKAITEEIDALRQAKAFLSGMQE